MPEPRLGPWKAVAIGSLAIVVAVVPLARGPYPGRAPEDALPTEADAEFVGRQACAECHAAETEAWTGSDHDLAMAEATDATVLGDFDDATFSHDGVESRFFRRDGKFMVETEGPDGAQAGYEVAYVFGHDPLQQYLIPFPGGRLQALGIAWDRIRGCWFDLYPDTDIQPGDWMHWTRNAQNWNGMCAECHSTNLRKNYDPRTDTYATTWSEIDVSCEACHGPGSRHVAWARMEPMARPEAERAGLLVPARALSPAQEVELCAPCHSRRSELGDYDHRGVELLDHMVPSLLVEGLYFPDGQILDEDYVYGSFLQSRMYSKGVRCSDCHDVHSLRRKAEGNALCLQCHSGEAYDTRDHHFHEKEVDGKPSDGALCVKCHMPERPYMVIDWRADHSLRVPRPDLTAEIGTPNACGTTGCHADKPVEWQVEKYRAWYGQARKPHYGTVFARARAGDPAAGPELARLALDPLQATIVRATALDLLGQDAPDLARAASLTALQDGSGLVRRAAVEALVEPDPAPRAEALAPLLSDPLRAVRVAAAVRLAGIPPRLLKPYQRAALRSAIDEYVAAMEHSLDFAQSAHNLGLLYDALDEPRESERYYRRAIAIDALFFPAKVNLAMLLNRAGRNDEAAGLLREVLDAYPDRYDVAYSLALLLVEMGRPEEALPWLRKAADGLPGRPRVLYNLGLLLQQMRRPGEAEQAFARLLTAAPDDADALAALAILYLQEGQRDAARATIERLRKAHPDDPRGPQLEAALRR